jgi:ATP phosphoribosyltransferase
MEILMANPLKLVIPKGRLQEKVTALLQAIGIDMIFSSRSYRPLCSDPDIEIKLLKPQNISPLLALSRHDCGFSGYDWVLENDLDQSPDLVKLLDLGFNKVRIVAAVPDELAVDDRWKRMRLVVASEYTRLASKYIQEKKLDAVLLKSHGATEALPPEDADMIIVPHWRPTASPLWTRFCNPQPALLPAERPCGMSENGKSWSRCAC